MLDRASEVLVVGEHPPDEDPSAFEYANLIITGLAKLRAEVLDTTVEGIAIWDGLDAGDRGGTASVVRLWRDLGIPIEHVEVIAEGDRAVAGEVEQDTGEIPSQGRWPYRYSVEAMLFADATGYSRLTEQQIPLFFEHYMGAIAKLNRTTDYMAVHTETAGDGLYMVFDDTATAANYALELSELITNCDWST